jgi:hypothetical protein
MPTDGRKHRLVEMISKMGSHSLLTKMTIASDNPAARAVLWAAAAAAEVREVEDSRRASEDAPGRGKSEWFEFLRGERD